MFLNQYIPKKIVYKYITFNVIIKYSNGHQGIIPIHISISSELTDDKSVNPSFKTSCLHY